MSFQVVWPQRTVQALAAAYLAARAVGQADAVSDATRLIDHDLSDDPMTRGESRSGNTRIHVVSPLVVEFEVFEDERVVVITELRFVPPRG